MQGLRTAMKIYDEEAFKRKPFFFCLVGLPASGKSTRAVELSEQYNANIHSSDAIRKELTGDENSQDQNELVFKVLHSRIFDDLNAGKNVIYDATNINIKSRNRILSQLKEKKIECYKVCVLMATPYEDCIYNNQHRDRIIPNEVLARMYKNFEMPSKYEGYDEVQIYYSEFSYLQYKFHKKIEYLKLIPHDNPNHTYSIGRHCVECKEQMKIKVRENGIDEKKECILLIASLFHDIGKEFVKDFKNSKGETTDIAHYYQHHCVSAYESLFYLKGDLTIDELIKIILLINHHMKPFDWERNENPDKAIKKFKALYGEEFYEDIMLLHECDLKAH